MKELILHPLAKFELAESAKWYNERQHLLGNEFVDKVFSAIEFLDTFPEMWPEVYAGIRRCHVVRFPFSILYQAIDDTIFVFAIMHDSRKPGYWINRLDS